MKFTGRKKPYTEIGIRRLACQRCGEQAVHQWNCCANGNYWVPICLDCDILLNAVAMEFMHITKRHVLQARYVRRQRATA